MQFISGTEVLGKRGFRAQSRKQSPQMGLESVCLRQNYRQNPLEGSSLGGPEVVHIVKLRGATGRESRTPCPFRAPSMYHQFILPVVMTATQAAFYELPPSHRILDVYAMQFSRPSCAESCQEMARVPRIRIRIMDVSHPNPMGSTARLSLSELHCHWCTHCYYYYQLGGSINLLSNAKHQFYLVTSLRSGPFLLLVLYLCSHHLIPLPLLDFSPLRGGRTILGLGLPC